MRPIDERPRGIVLLALAIIVLLVAAIPLSVIALRGVQQSAGLASEQATVPLHHKVTNLRDVSFTVSWTTNESQIGYIKYGVAPGKLTDIAYDERGSSFSGTTHHVTFIGLLPETTYYHSIISGGRSYNNRGAPYAATTGASIGIPPPGVSIYGQVLRSDGDTPAEGAIVYAIIRNADGAGSQGSSGEMSYLIREADQGYWICELSNAREMSNEGLAGGHFQYSPTGDKVELYAQGGEEGFGQKVVDTGTSLPVEAMILQKAAPAPVPTPTRAPTEAPAPTGTPVEMLTPSPEASWTPTPMPSPTPIPTPAAETVYVVQPGDTLYSVALRFGTTVQAIIAANDLSDPDFVWVGQRLIIPGVPSITPTSVPTPTPAVIMYIVQPGDTLYTIAAMYDTSVEAIVRANDLADPSYIWVDQRLVIPSEGKGEFTYTVQPGDNLYSIATRFGTTTEAIIAANELLNPDFIYVGQVLIIPL